VHIKKENLEFINYIKRLTKGHDRKIVRDSRLQDDIVLTIRFYLFNLVSFYMLISYIQCDIYFSF